MILRQLLRLLFPPKCILCRSLLSERETDLCPACRKAAPWVENTKEKLPGIAQWTGVWYYEKEVRKCLHRYKFSGKRAYAPVLGRFLAMQVHKNLPEYDVMTWVPISKKRLRRRGYDQSRLLAEEAAGQLGVQATPVLQKMRHNKAQSGLHGYQARKANVLGVYRVRGDVAGKRVLLVDDILTTGATAGECARVLKEAGASQVLLATVGVARRNSKKSENR